MAKSLETIALGVVGEMRRQREPGINPREHRSDAIIVMKALLQVRDDAIAAAREEGRAAGDGEGVRDAAKVALDIECEEGAAFVCGDVSVVIKRSPYDAIRALSPATTEEP